MNTALAQCQCGSVAFDVTGAPIASVVCYCADCQQGWGQLEGLPNAGRVRDADGGTPYLLYRKDRVRCVRGAELLRRQKLKPGSATNRVVAACCNSAMRLDFEDSKHWVSMCRTRFQGEVPPLEMRICTRSRRDGALPADGLPSYAGFPLRFVARLLAARVAMLFRPAS